MLVVSFWRLTVHLHRLSAKSDESRLSKIIAVQPFSSWAPFAILFWLPMSLHGRPLYFAYVLSILFSNNVLGSYRTELDYTLPHVRTEVSEIWRGKEG